MVFFKEKTSLFPSYETLCVKVLFKLQFQICKYVFTKQLRHTHNYNTQNNRLQEIDKTEIKQTRPN